MTDEGVDMDRTLAEALEPYRATIPVTGERYTPIVRQMSVEDYVAVGERRGDGLVWVSLDGRRMGP